MISKTGEQVISPGKAGGFRCGAAQSGFDSSGPNYACPIARDFA